jgi:hypothetical protein
VWSVVRPCGLPPCRPQARPDRRASEDFTDERALGRLREWIETGTITYDTSHVRPFDRGAIARAARDLGERLAAELRRRPAIMGIFDEGCMGMYNAIIPDDQLMAVGVYKERLSQAALYHAMTEVPDDEAAAVRAWIDAAGMRFDTGTDPATELTDAQILDQCPMYIAALRIADEFGCDLIGIQYQQGLKDLAPARASAIAAFVATSRSAAPASVV